MQVLRCARKKLDPDWVMSEAKRISTILSHLSPESVYLFGSAAEAEMTDQSDFDFLILFESSQEIRTAQTRLRQSYPLSSYPVDIVWTTKAEFTRKQDVGGVCFIVHREGVCLYRSER